MKKSFWCMPAAVILLLSFFSSCDVGLGEEVDLIAPEITVTNPNDGDNVHKKIRIEGTCKDNIKVTEIDVVESRSGGEIVPVGKGIINGERWYVDVEFDEGERYIICTAKDAAGNSSPMSKAVLNLIVDDTPAEEQGWYIDRGKNIQVSLMEKQKLQEVNCDLAANKFIPQNESFTIYGKFFDSISIARVILHLYEDDESVPFSSKEMTAENVTTGSIYAPAWDFTQDELVDLRPSLVTGKHYVRVGYEVYDDAGNRSSGSAGYLLWYPESDLPGIEQGSAESSIVVNVGSSIPVYFFDDDELVEVRYKFVTEKEKVRDDINDQNLLSYVGDPDSSLAVSQTEYPIQIPTVRMENGAEKPFPNGTYYLLLYVKDKNRHGEIHERNRLVKIILRDSKNPIIRIDSPKENEKPDISNGSEFAVSGSVSDTTGCAEVKVAYIPELEGYKTAEQKQKRAKEIFGGASPKNGEFFRIHEFDKNKGEPNFEGYIVEDFSFSFDINKDFPKDNRIKDKFFMFAVTDIDDNVVYRQWVVGSDSDAPEFKIEPGDMTVVNYSTDRLEFKFKANKASKLGIKESTYVVTRNGTEKYTFDNNKLKKGDDGFIHLTFEKKELKEWINQNDSTPYFDFECEDIIGIKGKTRRQIVLSELPALESVMVNQAEGIYGIGQEITFQAKFSDTVKVSGNPILELGGFNDGKERYADYVPGEMNSDTLKFKYTVNDGDVSSGVSCKGVGILLNGGKIETGIQGTGNAFISFAEKKNFWDSDDRETRRTIRIDGVSPKINKVSASVTDVSKYEGKYHAKEGREVLVDVEFSEAVSISGNANLKILTGDENEVLNFVQHSMSNDGKKVTYSYMVGSNANGNSAKNFNNVELQCNLAECFNFAGKQIKDEAGNSLSEGSETQSIGVVLDTVKPGRPTVNGISEEIYNESPEFFASKNDADDDIMKIEISVDNGQKWFDYSGASKATPASGDPWKWADDGKTKLKFTTGGDYNVIARATDKAGNVSGNSDLKKLKLNDKFPDILDILVANENGNYKKGDVLTFKVFLGDKLKPYVADDAVLTIKTKNPSSASKQRDIKVMPATDSSVLVFTHKVIEEDLYDGIEIAKLNIAKLVYKYDNKAQDSTKLSNRIEELKGNSNGGCHRPGIKVDGKAPSVINTVPANNKIASDYTSDGHLRVKLTFDERVYRESGSIILRRKGTWAIPAVMTVDEFNKVYNSSSLNETDRNKLKFMENGTELLDARTGIASGPYRRITHGLLKDSDGNLTGAPDISEKYVLDFNLGLYSGSTDIDPKGKNIAVSVDDIRKVFEKAEYHQHSVQVNSTKITASDDGKTYTVEFPVKVQDGIEWEIVITNGAFRDDVGNLYGGMGLRDASGNLLDGKQEYTLWTDKVSAPVIRVDRYSHGYGATEPDGNGNLTDINVYVNAGSSLQEKSGGKIAPTGYVRVRIDSQTPGAVLHYKEINKGAFDVMKGTGASWGKYIVNQGGGNKLYQEINGSYLFTAEENNNMMCSVSKIPDAQPSDFSGNGVYASYEQNSGEGKIIVIGDGEYKTARKDYVVSYASVPSGRTTNDNGRAMTNSDNGAEGVFKTVIYSKNYQGDNQFNIEGGTTPYGEAKVSGFPLRDGESKQYSKNAYHVGSKENIWVSFEIVSTDWAVLYREGSNSKNYPLSSYGQGTFTSGYMHY